MINENFKHEVKNRVKWMQRSLREWDTMESQGKVSHTPATLADYEEYKRKIEIYTPLIESGQWDIIAKMVGYEEKVEESKPETAIETKKSVIPE